MALLVKGFRAPRRRSGGGSEGLQTICIGGFLGMRARAWRDVILQERIDECVNVTTFRLLAVVYYYVPFDLSLLSCCRPFSRLPFRWWGDSDEVGDRVEEGIWRPHCRMKQSKDASCSLIMPYGSSLGDMQLNRLTPTTCLTTVRGLLSVSC